jgi:hypothetical protein
VSEKPRIEFRIVDRNGEEHDLIAELLDDSGEPAATEQHIEHMFAAIRRTLHQLGLVKGAGQCGWPGCDVHCPGYRYCDFHAGQSVARA